MLKKIAGKYVRVMDRVISRFVGHDASPAFFVAKDFYPDLLKIDQSFEEIKHEIEPLLSNRESIRLVHESIGGHPLVEGWRVLYVYFYGMTGRFPNQEKFPTTVSVLNGIPNVVDAFFSVLEPKKSIKAHRGLYRGFLRYHTAFRVPAANPPSIRVKDTIYTWKYGESVMFDDRHEHEVYNNSDDVRVVLITDVMRPLPWYLHVPNVIAIKLIGILYMKPAIQGGSLTLKGDVWDTVAG